MRRRARKRAAMLLLTLAAGAVAVDRLVLSADPRHAAASAASAAGAAAGDDTAAPAGPEGAPPSLADLFESIAPLASAPGGLSSPEALAAAVPSLFGVTNAGVAGAAAAGLPGPRGPATRADGLPELTGISHAGAGNGAAVLDGRIIRVGDTIGPYRLVEVDRRGAVVVDSRGRHRLELAAAARP